MTLVVCVPTYRRPDRIRDCVADLLSQSRMPDHVLVRQDQPPAESYETALDFLPEAERKRVRWTCQAHLGKRGYWRTITKLLQDARALQPTRVVFLADDLRLEVDAFARAEALLQHVAHDHGVRGVRLHRDGRDTCWGLTSGEWLEGPERYRYTGWVDGAFYARAALFDLVDWRVRRVNPRRWGRRKTDAATSPLGSGVWQVLSQAWHHAGACFVQPAASLVHHRDGGVSVMNPASHGRAVDTHEGES